MKHLFFLAAAIAVSQPAMAEQFCSFESRLDRISNASFVLHENGQASVWVDAGSMGSDMQGRVYWNPQADQTANFYADDDGTLVVERDGGATIYYRCPNP